MHYHRILLSLYSCATTWSVYRGAWPRRLIMTGIYRQEGAFSRYSNLSEVTTMTLIKPAAFSWSVSCPWSEAHSMGWRILLISRTHWWSWSSHISIIRRGKSCASTRNRGAGCVVGNDCNSRLCRPWPILIWSTIDCCVPCQTMFKNCYTYCGKVSETSETLNIAVYGSWRLPFPVTISLEHDKIPHHIRQTNILVGVKHI